MPLLSQSGAAARIGIAQCWFGTVLASLFSRFAFLA